MDENERLAWLLSGDVSIQYQVQRDLLNSEQKELQERIASEGWGAAFLSFRQPDGHWGRAFYQPKWISTHYTILDLKNLGISPKNKKIRQSISWILQNHKGPDGGLITGGATTIMDSDLCINGMFLNYACYFRMEEDDLKSIVDLIIRLHMADGGFNCRINRSGAQHSSMHTTISVLEGIWEYGANGYRYRLEELQKAAAGSREFLLHHRLYQSDKTGKTIDKKFLMLSYPSRWKYDILRALDYFRLAGVGYDARMDDAVEVLLKKQRADHRWPVQARHTGQTHFEMEKTGGPSRWNTLRALRVLHHFDLAR